MRSYAIGDIHGQLARLQAAHALVAADRARVGDDTAPLVHLGDYVDRGPDSRGVLDYLVQGLAAGENWVLLRGNHDAVMRDFLGSDVADADVAGWLSGRFGGRETLASYGITAAADGGTAALRRRARDAVPAAQRALLDALAPFHHRGEVFFCHAGIRPGVPLDAQDEQDLIWIRGEFLDDRRDHGALIVHGHTPVDRVEHHGNRVDLDTGAGYGGPVSAVVIEGRDVVLLTPGGRMPVPPGRAGD
ncbi:metallophosphoesterase family protein [Rhodovulum euryhalinum]|uniref:metallophosphoesterase family protein n=1 Tax=Rhodovulum euryhalinum TaxID=35805 RepID=UPI0010442446|nr:metallophosphoesterase family protein [Rhodovulum euryhalinum]